MYIYYFLNNSYYIYLSIIFLLFNNIQKYYYIVKHVKINFKILKEENSSSSKSVATAKTLESLELKSKVNEFHGGWRVLWRLSEQTGDVYGYFFKSNSEIDKQIRESCQTKSICTFKFEYDNLDYDQIKNSLPKDFPGASFYGHIKKIVEIKN